jgi:hypothetical protein
MELTKDHFWRQSCHWCHQIDDYIVEYLSRIRSHFKKALFRAPQWPRKSCLMKKKQEVEKNISQICETGMYKKNYNLPLKLFNNKKTNVCI